MGGASPAEVYASTFAQLVDRLDYSRAVACFGRHDAVESVTSRLFPAPDLPASSTRRGSVLIAESSGRWQGSSQLVDLVGTVDGDVLSPLTLSPPAQGTAVILGQTVSAQNFTDRAEAIR